MCGIKAFIILPVAALHFSIMAGSIGLNQFMADSQLLQPQLKDGGFIRAAMGTETLCEFLSVICLDTLNGAGECPGQMLQKQHGRIGTVLFKSFYKAPAGVFINGSVLVKMISSGFIYKTGRGDKFHVNLDALSGMAICS